MVMEKGGGWRDAGMGGVKDGVGGMSGKLMCVGQRKCRLSSHHQDFNMHRFTVSPTNAFLYTKHIQTVMHTHIPRTQLEHSKPAV